MLRPVQLCHQCGASLGDGDRFCRTCGSSAVADEAKDDPLIGRVIAGSYVVLDLVGVGGMGRVYRAEQRMLGRTVAIKVVHPHLLSDEQSVARFYTEARAASRLNHPNSVSIIDFGRTDDGVLYLVMEHLNGKDLSRLIHDDGPLPFVRICSIVEGVLAALGEAHALEVVHRDLKPENVIVETMRVGDDLIKVVDFGLAKLMGGAPVDTSITLPGLVCGTPDYMSPEQGRGEEVDGRGDLYSTGVLLFELLTEQLPFPADTPTNVVLRHIQDPIPDPREIAPARGIPDSLCQIVMKALAKDRLMRYQTAAEMAEALREAARELSPGAVAVECPACGHNNPATARFCQDCGVPVQSASAPPPSASGPMMSIPPPMQLATGRGVLIGRDDEIDRIESERTRAAGELRSVQLLGEAGIGKTRMLGEIADRAATSGDLVVGSGPHATGAPVPLYAIRGLIDGLQPMDDDALRALIDEVSAKEPAVAAGLSELIEPQGLVGVEGGSKASAVAAALAYLLHDLLGRASATRAVLMIDDLHLCDGLSAQTLTALAKQHADLPVLLITASSTRRDALISPDTVQIELRGVTLQEADAIVSRQPSPSAREPDPDDQLLLPLYVEYLRELGLQPSGSGGTLPPRLADAVMKRIQSLPVGAARLLQAICILGMRCERPMLEAVGVEVETHALEVLATRGLINNEGDGIEVAHPFVRDLVEASIPAEARKELHVSALAAAKAAKAPHEVWAHHAYGSGEVLGALVLLERMGDRGYKLGDLRTAVLGYQRALELARRELLISGDMYLEAAIESVSSRLGRVLAKRGDLTGAEGVLREAMEYSSPSSAQRALILIGLAGVLADKEREREAYRCLGQALEIAIQSDSAPAQVDVQVAVSRLRRADGNRKGATAALAAAQALLAEGDPDALKLAVVTIELASVELEADNPAGAGSALDAAAAAAGEAHAPFLEARVAALRAERAEVVGDAEAVRRHYADASQLAAVAGAVPESLEYLRLSGEKSAEMQAAVGGGA